MVITPDALALNLQFAMRGKNSREKNLVQSQFLSRQPSCLIAAPEDAQPAAAKLV
jgi:hypothetical protein